MFLNTSFYLTLQWNCWVWCDSSDQHSRKKFSLRLTKLLFVITYKYICKSVSSCLMPNSQQESCFKTQAANKIYILPLVFKLENSNRSSIHVPIHSTCRATIFSSLMQFISSIKKMNWNWQKAAQSFIQGFPVRVL